MNDLFKPDVGSRSTSDPFAFITSHGTEDDSPKEIRVKFDRRLLGAIMKDIVAPDDAWPQYRSIHDFVADACWHRLTFLNDWNPDVIPADVKADLEIYGRMAFNQQLEQRMTRYEEGMERARALIEKALRTDDHAALTEAVTSVLLLLRNIPTSMQWELQADTAGVSAVVDSLAGEDNLPPSATEDIIKKASHATFMPDKEGDNDGFIQPNVQEPERMVLDSLFIPRSD